MNRHIAIALTITTAIQAFCAPSPVDADSLGKKETFVIMGKAATDSDNKFSLAVTGYIKNRTTDIKVNPDGEFCETITMDGPLQEAYLYVDNTVTIPVAAGDTVVVDATGNSVTLSSPDPATDRDLRFARLQHDRMRQRYLGINSAAYGNPDTDSARQALADSINRYISDYNALICEFEKENGQLSKRGYFINAAYFGPLEFLAWNNVSLLDSITATPLGYNHKNAYQKLPAAKMIYPSAREFAIEYIRGLSSKTARRLDDDASLPERIMRIARAITPDTFVADLVNARQMEIFMTFDPYQRIRQYADSAIGGIRTGWIREHIAERWNQLRATAPGSELPALALKDQDGKPVSLEQFKGKVVLLDFWAIGCGPCTMEFKKMAEFKEAFHDKADDLQIITICCMEPSRKLWKKAIAKYRLDDLNTMLVPGESAAIYSQLSWPSYVLIGRDGKIFEWNTMRPSGVISQKRKNITTAIDKALAAD